MHKPTFVMENDTNKVVWEFEKQTDHRISVRQPDLIIIKKKDEKWELAESWTLLSLLNSE